MSLIAHCFSAPLPHTATPSPVLVGGEARVVHQWLCICCVQLPLCVLHSCETHWEQGDKCSSHIKGKSKVSKEKIEAKRWREERCTRSFSGPVRGGFCLSEQLQISDGPGFCTSAPGLDNLVLSAVVLDFFLFLLYTLGQKVLGKDFYLL